MSTETPETDAMFKRLLKARGSDLASLFYEEVASLERRNSELTAENEALNGKLTAAILGNQAEVDRLTARIAEMEKERDRLAEKVSTIKRAAMDAVGECETWPDVLSNGPKLRAALAEARKDGQRVDRLQAMSARGGPFAEHIDPLNDDAGEKHGVRVLVLCLPYMATKRPETIREAIDQIYEGPIDAPLPSTPLPEKEGTI